MNKKCHRCTITLNVLRIIIRTFTITKITQNTNATFSLFEETESEESDKIYQDYIAMDYSEVQKEVGKIIEW